MGWGGRLYCVGQNLSGLSRHIGRTVGSNIGDNGGANAFSKNPSRFDIVPTSTLMLPVPLPIFGPMSWIFLRHIHVFSDADGIIRCEPLTSKQKQTLSILMNWIIDFLGSIGRPNTLDYCGCVYPPTPVSPNLTRHIDQSHNGKGKKWGTSFESSKLCSPPRWVGQLILPLCHLTRKLLPTRQSAHRRLPPGTIQSMKDYLSDLWRQGYLSSFRATKVAAREELENTKPHCAGNRLHPQKTQSEWGTNYWTWGTLDEILTEGAHYNFPKMHQISHFADERQKYGSLPQFYNPSVEG